MLMHTMDFCTGGSYIYIDYQYTTYLPVEFSDISIKFYDTCYP